MITLKKVSKKYRKNVALTDININIAKKEFVFITGISGSGKTTLMRLMTKDLDPTTGTIIVNNHQLNQLKKSQIPKLRQSIGFVFQDFKLLYDQTIFENVAMALKVINQPLKTIEKKVTKTLKLVGLSNKAYEFPSQLAGGELQRVCLARAVVSDPPILLADEPTGNLDPTTSWQIMELIKNINESGTTVVMATHNTDIVNSMSERVIQLEKGKIIQDSPNGKYKIE